MKIAHKVPLLVTVTVLSTFALYGAISYNATKARLLEQEKHSIKEISVMLETEISYWLNERLHSIDTMVDVIGDSTSEHKILDTLALPALAPLASSYYAALERGDGHFISHQDFPQNIDARSRPWYRLARQTQQSMMTNVYSDINDGRLLVSATKQLADGNGVVAADIELSGLAELISTANFNNTGYAFLVSNQGIIIHPDRTLVARPLSSLYTGEQPQMTTELQYRQIGNQEVLTKFYPLKGFTSTQTPWYLGVVADKDKVYAPAIAFAQRTIIAAIIAALICSLVLYFFMSSAVIKPVKRLTRQAEDISRGEANTAIEGSERKDEIGELAQSIGRMEKALNMAMQRLTAHRNRS